MEQDLCVAVDDNVNTWKIQPNMLHFRNRISFRNSAGGVACELLENGQGELVFVGDVSESAQMFFTEIVLTSNKWMVAAKQVLQQISDNSEDPEAKRMANNLLSGDY